MSKRNDKEQLILHLKKVASRLGHTPSCNEINKEGKYTHTMYLTYFGTIRNAQAEAGLTPNKKFNSPAYAQRQGSYITKEQCMDDISRIHAKLGRTPSLIELKKHGKYPYMVYYRRIGGIRKIKKLPLLNTETANP